MKNLLKLIDNVNFWPMISGKGDVIPTDTTLLTAAHAKVLYEAIEAGMSPENLHCDGEASPAHVRAMSKLYNGARQDLERLGFKYKEYTW